MKNLRVVALGAMFAVVAGCAGSSQSALKQETGKSSAPFQEAARGGGAPEGYADLTVTASIKTHKPRWSLVPDSHGSAYYRLLVSIDGEVAAVPAQLRLENNAAAMYSDPEAGEGIRYLFTNTFRLPAGTHQVRFSLPGDSVSTAHDITLASGSANRLLLEPVYAAAGGKQRPGFYGATSFKEGISRLQVALNGKIL